VREPHPKSILAHFSFKRGLTSGGSNFNDFPENQPAKIGKKPQ